MKIFSSSYEIMELDWKNLKIDKRRWMQEAEHGWKRRVYCILRKFPNLMKSNVIWFIMLWQLEFQKYNAILWNVFNICYHLPFAKVCVYNIEYPFFNCNESRSPIEVKNISKHWVDVWDKLHARRIARLSIDQFA